MAAMGKSPKNNAIYRDYHVWNELKDLLYEGQNESFPNLAET